MLAQSQSVFKTPEAFREAVSGSDMIAEVKQDGCRIMLCYHPGVGFELYSRNRSVENCLFGSYVDKIYGWQRQVTENVLPFSFIIDGELVSLNPSVNGHVVTDTMLGAVVSVLGMNQLESHRMQAEAGYPMRLQAFDVVMYDGESVMEKPLSERKKVLHEVVVKLREAGDRLALPQLWWVEEVPVIKGGWDYKQKYFNEVVSAGGEGLVLKRVDSLYQPFEARGGMSGAWLKWKRTVSQSVGSDVDAFVLNSFTAGEGRYEGLIGSVDFGVYLVPSGKTHTIASVSGLSDADRKALTDFDEHGNMRVNPAWVGRVGVIDGQDMSNRSLAFQHARLLRWRGGADGKFPAQCTFDEALLNQLVL
jgi:ATP-dependent DNA ligase